MGTQQRKPIQIAAEYNKSADVKKALIRADVNEEYCWDGFVLFIAEKNNTQDVVNVLKKAGAKK